MLPADAKGANASRCTAFHNAPPDEVTTRGEPETIPTGASLLPTAWFAALDAAPAELQGPECPPKSSPHRQATGSGYCWVPTDRSLTLTDPLSPKWTGHWICGCPAWGAMPTSSVEREPGPPSRGSSPVSNHFPRLSPVRTRENSSDHTPPFRESRRGTELQRSRGVGAAKPKARRK